MIAFLLESVYAPLHAYARQHLPLIYLPNLLFDVFIYLFIYLFLLIVYATPEEPLMVKS